MSKIELRQVNKRYPGAPVLTINKADLTIDDGEFCVFVGPSGCGKSTLLRMVPNGVREAALGLGIPRWRTTLSVVLRTATPGVVTGVMLAFARVAGETAPLLFTAFGNQFWNLKLSQPMAALPLQIYVYAISPYDDWHRQAWAGALVLIVLIVGAVAAVRLAASRGLARGAA